MILRTIVDKSEQLRRDSFISSIMVGKCPNCGGANTHDCESEKFEYSKITKEIMKTGSKCWASQKIDDITIGHCDDCNFLWCLECGSPISEDKTVCSHWAICGDCGKDWEYPENCPSKDEAESGELLVNPCLLGCPDLKECSKCPYDLDIGMCPSIQEFRSSIRSE